MSRPLKFRAWCRAGGSGYMAIQGTPDLESLYQFMFHYGGEALLMQLTGRHDKNGTEIYEGDIVGLHRPTYRGNGSTKIEPSSLRIIAWQDVGYNLRPPRSRNGGPAVNHYEVIGNIYENPELVKQIEAMKKEPGNDPANR